MAGIETPEAVLHRIRVRLYPSHLTTVDAPLVARVEDERMLSIEEICASMKERGGFTGNFEDAENNIKQFCEEGGFLLLDGYGLNMKYYSIHPKVGGGWHDPSEGADRAKHPVGFSFRVRNPLKTLADKIVLNVLGVADNQGSIYEMVDESNGQVDETCSMGQLFTIHGTGLKVEGDADHTAVVGVFFETLQSTGLWKAQVVAVNEPKTLKVIVPTMPTPNTAKVKVITQSMVSGGSRPMKEIREVTSSVVLTVQ
jgi:hypothetical protein